MTYESGDRFWHGSIATYILMAWCHEVSAGDDHQYDFKIKRRCVITVWFCCSFSERLTVTCILCSTGPWMFHVSDVCASACGRLVVRNWEILLRKSNACMDYSAEIVCSFFLERPVPIWQMSWPRRIVNRFNTFYIPCQQNSVFTTFCAYSPLLSLRFGRLACVEVMISILVKRAGFSYRFKCF